MEEMLVLQAARFGDLLQSRRLIKTAQLQGKVHLCVDASLANLARLLYPDIIIHNLYFHGSEKTSIFQHNINTLASLSKINFKKIINCNFSPLTASLCFLFEKKNIIGYRPNRQQAGGIERSPWARFAFRLTQKRILSSLNLEDFWAHFLCNPVSSKEVNPLPKPRGEAIGIACAGREQRRSLSIPALKNIINCLNRIYNKPEFIFLGSAKEQPIAKKLIHALSGVRVNISDLTGKTDWPELVNKILSLKLLISPDTGLMHLAAFLGVPVMSFFLSSAWAHETGPYGENHIIWQSVSHCSPCLESSICREQAKCASIFESPEFIRLFSQYLLNPEKYLEFPAGLQLWKSGFDNAGQILELIRGNDPYEEGRRTARDFLKRFLKLSARPFSDFQNDWVFTCGKLLDPDDEWMLPPQRYC